MKKSNNMDILDCGEGVNYAFDEREAEAALLGVRTWSLSSELQDALTEYRKMPQDVCIGHNSLTDKVRWLCRRCDGDDRTISHLHEENRELLRLLKSVHMWFMEKAPEHYNGCGLWIDIDATLRISEQPCCGRSLRDCDCEPQTQGKVW